MRVALGATRRQIVRQLLAESVVLAIAAGVLGVVIASISTDALLLGGSQTVALPRLADVAIDWRVLDVRHQPVLPLERGIRPRAGVPGDACRIWRTRSSRVERVAC